MSGVLAHHGGAASELLADHGAHALMLVGPLVVAAGLFTMLELTGPDRPGKGRKLVLGWLALTWAAAATIHLAVIAEHLEESAALGVFFLLLSLAQYAYAVAVVVRGTGGLLRLGLAFHVAVVLLWAYSRTVALPLGLGPREPVGVADLVATVLELGALVLTWAALRRTPSSVAEAPAVGVDDRVLAPPG